MGADDRVRRGRPVGKAALDAYKLYRKANKEVKERGMELATAGVVETAAYAPVGHDVSMDMAPAVGALERVPGMGGGVKKSVVALYR